jgi:hypothetical protein
MSKLIEKEGKFYKECRVDMLDADWIEASKSNRVFTNNWNKSLVYGNFNYANQDWDFKHIYITSNDEIKDGDWCLFFWDGGQIGSGKPQQYQPNKGHVLNKGLRKIIATTDTSLKLPIPEGLAEYPMSYTPKSLPQPSDKFIESYIDAHNKGGNIERVLVEYELFDEYGNIIMGDLQRESDTVRLKLKNDNIVIKKVKDSWSKDEVCNLLNEYRVYTWKNGSTANDLIKWIEENL